MTVFNLTSYQFSLIYTNRSIVKDYTNTPIVKECMLKFNVCTEKFSAKEKTVYIFYSNRALYRVQKIF